MKYRFGRHTLDLATHELAHDGERVEMEPRSFAVLVHLLAHRDRVVPKHELLDEVWGDRFVSESALTTRIKDCRRALGDDGTTQRFIKTVHRVGYRFIAEVTDSDRGATSDRGLTVTSDQPVAVSPAWGTGRAGQMFGRDASLAELRERIRSNPVVTVTGPGGIGKSRLCAALIDDAEVAGPVWTGDLTSARGPDALAEVVLGALGERQQSDTDPLTTIGRVIADRPGLLVLDNCEHLVEAVRPVVETVAAGGATRVLATSRMPLDVTGESVLVLEPLALDAAIDCFVARATDTGASVDADDPAVADLCERLDRLPLALELAAARARLLEPRQIIDLLDDRFRLLRRGGEHQVDGSHASLAATIAWSWDLLGPDEQQLLAELATFVGSFSLEDASGVVMPDGDVLDTVDGLDRLLRVSMIVALTGPGGVRRFRLLESIRDFATERLDAPDEVRHRHAQYFADLVERHDAGLATDHVDSALAGIGDAWANVRAAVDYSIAGEDLTCARRIIRSVGAYADLYQVYEVIDWCRRAKVLDLDGRPASDHDRALVADTIAIWARLLAHRGEQGRATELVEVAHGTAPSFATWLSRVWIAYYGGDLDAVVSGAEQLNDLARSDTGIDRAYADGFLAVVATVRQIPEIETTDVTPTDADDGLLGTLRCLSAGFRLCTADPEQAAELLEAVVARSLRRDYRLLLGAAASTLTQITLPSRPLDEAMATLCRTLDRYLERGMWPLISADTVMAATLLADAGELEVAARLLGARNSSGYRSGLSEVGRAALEQRLRSELGERFEALAAEGATWSPPRAGETAVATMRRQLADSV